MLFNKRAQSTLEYALVIAGVVAALVAVNIYLQKGVQGRLKESADQIGRQFDPANFTTAWKTEGGVGKEGSKTISKETRDITTGAITTNITTSETTTKGEYEDFGSTAPTQHY